MSYYITFMTIAARIESWPSWSRSALMFPNTDTDIKRRWADRLVDGLMDDWKWHISTEWSICIRVPRWMDRLRGLSASRWLTSDLNLDSSWVLAHPPVDKLLISIMGLWWCIHVHYKVARSRQGNCNFRSA